jgi:hypothetical protein
MRARTLDTDRHRDHAIQDVCADCLGVRRGELSITRHQRGWLRAHNAGRSDHKLDAVRCVRALWTPTPS